MNQINIAPEIRRFRAVLAAFAAVAVIALAVGCGGGDDEPNEANAGVASNEAGSEGPGGEGPSQEGAGGGEAGGGSESPGGSPGAEGEPGGGGTAEGGGPGGGLSEQGSLNGSGASGGGGGKKGSGGSGSGGGGSAGGAAGGGSSAKTKFIKEADEICRKWGKKIQTDAQKGYSGDLNGSKKQVREGINSLVRATEKYVVGDLESELKEVQALNAPADAEEAAAAAEAAIKKLIDGAKDDPEGLILGSKAGEEAEALTKPQGFSACGDLVGQLS